MARPNPLVEAHKHSATHREEVLRSVSCGCFHCCATFPPAEIEEWIDEVDGVNTTALCPRCGIDSVIGDASGYPMTKEFLAEMSRLWFTFE